MDEKFLETKEVWLYRGLSIDLMSAEDLRIAFSDLASRYESLRARLDQTVEPPKPPPFRYVKDRG